MGRPDTLPFGVNDFALSTGTYGVDLAALLGQTYETEDGKVWQLVQLNEGAAIDVRKRAFMWNAAATYKVERATGTASRTVGVGNPSMLEASVNDLGYFMLQIGGRTTIIQGDDFAANPIDGTKLYAEADDDADQGKCHGAASFTHGVSFGRYVSGAAGADDTDIVVDLLATLAG